MKSLLAICLLSLASFSYAQETSDTFQIKDYKYRTPGFKALSFDFNFGGGFTEEGVVDSFKIIQKGFALSPARFNFYKVSSSDYKFHESNYSFVIAGTIHNNTTPQGKTKNSIGFTSFEWRTSTQYFQKNNWFWELGNQMIFSGDFSKNKSESMTFHRSILYVSDYPILGIGKGRIETVNDAQMSLFILNDLENEGLIANKGTKEQQYAFAQVITDINNQRIFDNRRKRIYELQRIDSFLKNSGLSTTTDIRHFTTINDNWIYAFTPIREHGNQWYVRIGPGAEYRKDNSKSNYNTYFTEEIDYYRTFSIGPEVGYESKKAISLKWQRNFSINVSYKNAYSNYKTNYEKNDTLIVSNKSDYHHRLAKLTGTYMLGYFPNTRTFISAELGANFQHGNFLFYNEDGILFNTGLQLQTSYFLGYRTRLSAGINISYQTQDIQFNPLENPFQYYGFNTGVQCGISHNIF
jgi:hypothetical protein